VSLRPAGIGRYFVAAFLSVWLVGWIVGEAVAIAALGAILGTMTGVLSERPAALPAGFFASGGVAFVIVFLAVWLTFWTFGGIAAMTQLLRSLAGEDSIELGDAGFALVRRAGPFRRRSLFERPGIRRIRLRPHDKAIVADTRTGTHMLTRYGSAHEREEIRDWLSQYLQLPDENAALSTSTPPAAWEVISGGDSTALRKVRPRVRAIRAVITWLLAGAAAAAWYASFDAESPARSIPTLALTVLIALGAAVTTWGRREWIVRHGELTFRRRLALWSAEQTFRSGRLDVTHETDSDNDSSYTLMVVDANGRKAIHSQIHDSGEVVDLGHWLAARSGFPLASVDKR
jgi:hypothetical protein